MDLKKYIIGVENEFFLGMVFFAEGIIISVMIVTLPIWLPIRMISKKIK